MIVEDKGLDGSIRKDKDGYSVDVHFSGWGNLTLYEILERVSVLNKLENMSVGESIVFRDNFVITM